MIKNNPEEIKARKANQPKSWGEDIERYRHSKMTLNYEIQKPDLKTRDKSGVWREAQRELNPITQKFIVDEKEQANQKVEEQTRLKKQEKTVGYGKKYAAPFDIVTNQPKQSEAVNPKVCSIDEFDHKKADIKRKQTEAFNSSPLNQKPKDADSLFGSKKIILEPASCNLPKNRIVYDIINPDVPAKEKDSEFQKLVAKEEAKKEKIKDTFEKNKFDIITQKYEFNAEKNKELDAHDKAVGDNLKERKEKIKPQTIKNSEGAAFDPINCRMKEESVYQEILKKEEIKLGHAYKGVERANEMKDKFAEKDEKMNELSYNRRAKHPIVEFQQQARDFHIINNKPYEGLGKKSSFIPVESMKKQSLWDNLQNTDPNESSQSKKTGPVRTGGFPF